VANHSTHVAQLGCRGLPSSRLGRSLKFPMALSRGRGLPSTHRTGRSSFPCCSAGVSWPAVEPPGAPAATEPAFAAAIAPVAAASPTAVAPALALPICESHSTGPGGRTRAAAASKDPAACSVSASYSAPSRSAPAAGPCVVARGGAAAAAAVDKPSRSLASPAVAGYRLCGPPFCRCYSRCYSASEDPAISSVSASYSAHSRSTSAAGPCVVAPGDAAAPAAVDKPSRLSASCSSSGFVS